MCPSIYPVRFGHDIGEYFAEKSPFYKNFLVSISYSEQLQILNDIVITPSPDLTHFLVVCFLETPSKHPVKGFIVRHINKTVTMQEQFSLILAEKLKAVTSTLSQDYSVNMKVVTKISSCIENFPAAGKSFWEARTELQEYFKQVVSTAVNSFRSEPQPSLSEKKEIYAHCHLTLKLFLHIIQEYQTFNANTDESIVPKIKVLNETDRRSLKLLLIEEDSPMDTKNLCGIIIVTAFILEEGLTNLVELLLNSPSGKQETWLQMFQSNDTENLALYSALSTISGRKWAKLCDVPAISAVAELVLQIGYRLSSDPSVTLSVARTLLQLSKYLGTLDDAQIEDKLAETLMIYVATSHSHSIVVVRYLAIQTLQCIAKYYINVKEWEWENFERLLSSTFTQNISKGYFWVVSAILNHWRGPIDQSLFVKCLNALSTQEFQSSAALCAEQCITKLIMDETSFTFILNSVRQNIGQHEVLDSAVIFIYAKLIMNAAEQLNMESLFNVVNQTLLLTGDEALSRDDMVFMLILFLALQKTSFEMPPDYITTHYKILKDASVNYNDEIRIITLATVVESKKSTKIFKQADFEFILHFLKYNINTQSPSFRQLTLSAMMKFTQRLSDSYAVLHRQNMAEVMEYYADFTKKLRELCFSSLIKGANFSRRCVSLQLLLWVDRTDLPGARVYSESDIEKIIYSLGDSYENNKQLALDVLKLCDPEILEAKCNVIGLTLERILEEASSVRPTDCTTAAYKLKLLTLLPSRYLERQGLGVSQNILQVLLWELSEEVDNAENNIVVASAEGPMYGLVHCIRRLIGDHLSKLNIPFVHNVIKTCMRVNHVVAPIVNNSSPEGHLPMDFDTVIPGSLADLTLEDFVGNNQEENVRRVVDTLTADGGNSVTAQMVLLCGWRSIKEVSLLFGELCSWLPIEGETTSWLLSRELLRGIGDHFIALLSETKHRGAFEQAYVGFTQLASRLWKCQSADLHLLPNKWLVNLMQSIHDANNTLCATRRSAGLPYIIQALVITELQVHDNDKCFHKCMSWLLQNANRTTDRRDFILDESQDVQAALMEDSPRRAEIRTHCLNILRALYRNTSLGETASSRVEEGLIIAIRGLDAPTWSERNSSALLLSALMVRIFGVQRTKDADRLCVRNKMTSRIFFLRYPNMYDFMMDMLKNSKERMNGDSQRTSLFGVLLILARLYESPFERTDSNLMLSAFVVPVMCCGTSSVLQTRRLAAKAVASLISPQQWPEHVMQTLQVLNCGVTSNQRHGLILQLIRLFEEAPESVKALDGSIIHGLRGVVRTCRNQCYYTLNDTLILMNFALMRFPGLASHDLNITMPMNPAPYSPGLEICVANYYHYKWIIYLIPFQRNLAQNSKHLTIDVLKISLTHEFYEVVLAGLNFILTVFGKLPEDNYCGFTKHLNKLLKNEDAQKIPIENVIKQALRQSVWLRNTLCIIIRESRILDCVQKALKALICLGDNASTLIEIYIRRKPSHYEIVTHLLTALWESHDSLSPLYFEVLLNFISNNTVPKSLLLEVLRVVCKKSTSNNDEAMRSVCMQFVKGHFYGKLLLTDPEDLNATEQFEYEALRWCILMTLLEDDCESIRQSASSIAANAGVDSVLASFAGKEMRRKVALTSALNPERNVPLMLLLALFDFNSEVCMLNDTGDAYRVFDQSERYNVQLEEVTWTQSFAKKILPKLPVNNPKRYISNIIQNPTYKTVLENLCGNNLVLFKRFMNQGFDDIDGDSECWNPKVEIFIKCLGL